MYAFVREFHSESLRLFQHESSLFCIPTRLFCKQAADIYLLIIFKMWKPQCPPQRGEQRQTSAQQCWCSTLVSSQGCLEPFFVVWWPCLLRWGLRPGFPHSNYNSAFGHAIHSETFWTSLFRGLIQLGINCSRGGSHLPLTPHPSKTKLYKLSEWNSL